MNLPKCPNCGSEWNYETCAQCGYQRGEPLAFWPRIRSCSGMFVLLLFAVSGYCSVSGGYGAMHLDNSLRDIATGLSLEFGLLFLSVSHWLIVGYWLESQWPASTTKARLKALTSRSGGIWRAITGWLALACTVYVLAATILFYAATGGAKIPFLGQICFAAPIAAVLGLVSLALSLKGRS